MTQEHKFGFGFGFDFESKSRETGRNFNDQGILYKVQSVSQ